jgi:hypothetical protein
MESRARRYKKTARKVLLLDTRFATKLAAEEGYKGLAAVPQFQQVRISLLCFWQLTFIGS